MTQNKYHSCIQWQFKVILQVAHQKLFFSPIQINGLKLPKFILKLKYKTTVDWNAAKWFSTKADDAKGMIICMIRKCSLYFGWMSMASRSSAIPQPILSRSTPFLMREKTVHKFVSQCIQQFIPKPVSDANRYLRMEEISRRLLGNPLNVFCQITIKKKSFC